MTIIPSLREDYKDINSMLFKGLSDYVIGHDYAKKVLINTINKSRLRALQKQEGVPETSRIGQNNCLLIGESGTGKTHLVKSLSKLMDFPLVTVDATDLIPTASTGGISSEDLCKRIVRASIDFDLRFTSSTGSKDSVIVFVDEIDKLADKLSSDWNEHTQANFLKLFENTREGVENVTYIFAGAFRGLEKYETKRKGSMGFMQSKHDIADESNLTQKIISYGLIPELVGRMNHIVLLDRLEEKHFKRILKDKILPRAKEQMKVFGIENFKITKKQEEEIIQTAVNSRLGVRGMQSAIDTLLVEYEFNPTLYRKNKP